MTISSVQGAVIKKAAAAAVLAGFVMLAVFGGFAVVGSGGQSLLSCVASSAGLVCDSHGGSYSMHHEISSFLAVTSSIGTAYAALLALLALSITAFAQSLALPVRAAGNRVFLKDSSDWISPSVLRLRRWLSLFESSPGR